MQAKLWRLGCVSILLMAFPCAVTSSGQDERKRELPGVPQILDALEAAINSIRSFDVQVLASWEQYYSVDYPDGKQPALRVFPKPHVSWYKSRQVFAKNGWRRVEREDSETGKPRGVIVAGDNEVERVLFPYSSRGTIRRAGGPSMNAGLEYQETFRTVYQNFRIMGIFRDRGEEVRASRDEKGRVVLEADPTKLRGVSDAATGYRVYADPALNMLPAVVEGYNIVDGKRLLRFRRTTTEWKAVGGVSVPTKSVREVFDTDRKSPKFGEVYSRAVLTVDVARSSWNEPINDDTFRLPFPAGLHVVDEIRDVAYFTGKADPGRNLEDLAANAQGLIHNVLYKPAVPNPYRWIWWLAVGSGAAVAVALVGWVVYRRRSARRAA